MHVYIYIFINEQSLSIYVSIAHLTEHVYFSAFQTAGIEQLGK